MRAIQLAMLASALLAVPLAVASVGGGGSPGPFTGSVGQSGVASHHYNNNLSGQPCIALASPYTVDLVHVPVDAVLTLSVDNGIYTATSSNGHATRSFTKGVCTNFTITVTGTSVADSADYVVAVRGGALAGGGGNVCDIVTPHPC